MDTYPSEFESSNTNKPQDGDELSSKTASAFASASASASTPASSSSSGAFPGGIDPNMPLIKERKAGIHSHKPYQCSFSGCSRSYLCVNNFKKHLRSHPKNFPCRYTPCVGEYVSPADRTAHEVSAHGKSQNYTCYLCPYSSDNRKYMRGHVVRMHREIPIDDALRKIIDDTSPEEYRPGQSTCIQQSVEQPVKKDYKCDICNTYSTDKYNNIYQHVRRVHKGVLMRDVMKRITSAVDVCEV